MEDEEIVDWLSKEMEPGVPVSVKVLFDKMKAQGFPISWRRIKRLLDEQIVGSWLERFHTPSGWVYVRTGYNAGLPRTVGSVVWFDGHPWVLDGEPEVPTSRIWIGRGRDGEPTWWPLEYLLDRQFTAMWYAPRQVM